MFYAYWVYGKRRAVVLSSACLITIIFFYFFVVGSALKTKVYTFLHRVTYENTFMVHVFTQYADMIDYPCSYHCLDIFVS